jgi:16S rRNA (guanine1207-N2)-methyltransferase
MVHLSVHGHYFSKKPLCKKKEYKLRANLFGLELELVTAAGIFSPRHVDLGSLTLTAYMQLSKDSKVLDLGCGYGVIGITAAKSCPSCKVIMVDINERAVACAKENILINNVRNATAKQSFMFSSLKDEIFDTILLNPPMSAGMDVCYEMIKKSSEHLKENGTLQLVAKNRKGGSRLMECMKETFGNVEVLGRKGGFWVYCSTKRI